MIIFKIRIFKLSDIDQGIYKHVIQKKYEFLACLKKVLQRKRKKILFLCIQDYVMQKNIETCMQNFFWKSV